MKNEKKEALVRFDFVVADSLTLGEEQ